MNSYGYSEASEILTVLIAQEPSKVSQPTTSIVNSDVVVDWSSPSANGSPITNYIVSIKRKDEVYQEQLDYCDGTLTAIVAAT